MKLLDDKIRILHLEDDPDDAFMVSRLLKKANLNCEIEVVDTRKKFEQSLVEFEPDIIISDHHIPSFDSMEALTMLKNSGSQIPFILLTGTVSEEYAIATMREGASDYLLKDRPQRLTASIRDSLEKFHLKAEQKKAYEKVALGRAELLKLNNRLMLATSSAGMGIWEWDLVNNRLAWDDGMHQLYKMDISQLGSYEGWLSCLHSQDRERVSEEIALAIAGEKEYNTEFKIVWKDSAVRYIKATGIVEHDESGTALRMVGMNWDVTQERANEKKIRESETLLSNINANSADMICMVSEEGKFIHVSAASEMVLGYTPAELIGKRIFDFTYPEDLEKTIKSANHVLDGTLLSNFENRFVRKDGAIVTLSWSARLDEVDRVRYGVARDVTEHKKIQAENEKLARIASLTVNAAIVTDAEGRIIWVNKGFERITEYCFEEVVGKKPSAFLQGLATDPVTIGAMREAIKQGQSFRGEILNYGKSGRQYWLDLEISPLTDSNGKLSGFMAIEQDITDRKKSEQENYDLIKRLEKRNRDLQQFSYIISHNLRAPIAKISGLASIIQPDNEENNFLMQKLTEETMLLDEVIRDINVIISARKSEREKMEYVLVKSECTLVLQSLDTDIVKSGAQVHLDFSEVKGITIIKSYLHSIIYNLVSNAVKYRLPNVPLTIHIKSTQDDTFVCLSVKDNGSGIDLEKNKSKIFGLYKRFHGADIPGKGVGLHLVKTHAESLGGHVEIESKLNEGTEFKVYLPKNYGNNDNSNN